LFSVLLLGVLSCFAQQNKALDKRSRTIDSLSFILKTFSSHLSSGRGNASEADTIRVNALTTLAWALRNNPDTAIILGLQALNLSTTLFKTNEVSSPLGKVREKFIANSYHILGLFNKLKGNYNLSLDYDLKALKIRESLNDKKGISATLGNIGNIYLDQDDYPNALIFYLKALKISEERGDKNEIARHLGNIGNIYNSKNDFPKSLDYYFKALKIAEEVGGKNTMSINLGNIGNAYLGRKDYSKALNYYFKALKMDEELGNKNGVARHLANIGSLYQERGDQVKLQNLISDSLYKKALLYDFKALKSFEELGYKNGIITALGNIGGAYTHIKKYKEAREYLQNALTLSTEIGATRLVGNVELSLSELFTQTNEPEKALEHYKKYIVSKDSTFNEEKTKKTVRSEMNFEFEKKQAIEKAEQEKQNAIAQKEKQKQKAILVLVSCFLLLVLVFASFMFNRWYLIQRQKRIIEKQKEKILDSITYAQLIQQSILMEESEIQKLLPNCFIYFQPKDIVSGDFYWCSKINNKIILAAVDCTGHGVPGAFMSMIGNTLLNQIVNEKRITTPSEILRLLNIGVYEALHQQKDGSLSRDGMDIALCCIDYSNNQIEYAGAKNPLFIVSDDIVTIIKGDKETIGSSGLIAKKFMPFEREYTNHIISIKKDMTVFLFSDGYVDQFESTERSKFGKQKFKELLLTNQPLNMQQQKESIVKAHKNWKGSTAQTDDVLVIGIKV
jgi:serine phosphatase RsbU (regulator of sigma subunit)